MHGHVSDEVLRRFMSGGLPPGEIPAVARHMSECVDCAARGKTSAGVQRAADVLAGRLDYALEEHPDVEGTLTAFVDGTLDPLSREQVEDHLESCDVCRDDVAVLREAAGMLKRSRERMRWPLGFGLAAAATAAVAFVGLTVMRREQPETRAAVQQAGPRPVPAPRPSGYGRPEWDAIVSAALQKGRIDPPSQFASLQLEAETLRGAPATTPAAALEPRAVIVETTRPRFHWPTVDEATYVVTVMEGARLVAQSPVLEQPGWRPDRALARGRVYTWQVEIQRADAIDVLPAPPDPPATFRVLDAAAHEQLEAARAAFPSDHTFLGVLYAMHGLRDEAKRELARVPGDEQVQRILASIRNW